MDETGDLILSKVNQAQKAKNCMFFLICRLYTSNKCSNIIGNWSQIKGRIYTGGIRKGRKLKT
jgi:hypothetical protein